MKSRCLLWAAAAAAALLVCLPSEVRASSSIGSTRISLPKGPGSIHGLGRNFEPSLASGTASYGVNIAMPPGAGGFGPSLSLEYDSGGGVSDLGMGWRLGGLPSLRVRVEDGLPRFDPSDTFEIDGFGVPSRLIEVSPSVYRPEFESGSFVRAQRAADGNSWEARDKSGTTYRFGGAVEFEGAHVATFLLREVEDLHGHRVSYTWDVSSGHGLLQSITWNDFGDDVRNVVTLGYDARPDVHTLFSAGIKQVFAKRLVTVDVTHGGSLVRRYALAYESSVHSRLASVTLTGRDGISKMPMLSFAYTAPSFATAGQVIAMTTPPGRSPGDANVEIADLDGDTLPDLLVTKAGAYRSYLNHDGRSWKAGVDWDASASPSLELSAVGVQLADLDGDGAIDLVAKSGTTNFRYFPGATATSFRASTSIATVPNFTFEDPDVRLADMDDDRRVDIVITTAAGLAVGFNKSGVDWTTPAIVGVVDPNQSLRFSDGGHTQLCDVNGDRVQDLCYLTPGSLAYWLGRGRGLFEPPQVATGVPQFDPSSPWELHDLDGDGWVDLVHVGVDQIDLALAVAAGSFGSPQAVAATPTRGPNTAVRFADMNGSGSVDVVWIDVSGDPASAWRYLELFPGGRAGLLSRIDNGLGRIVSITYGSAAEDAAAARDAGAPWTSRMNAGMAVVRSIEADASLGDPTIRVEYHYRDGTWSPVERTFAGFGGGIERKVGDEYAPTLDTETTFDVGIADRTQRGHVLTNEARDEKGYRFARTTTTYAARAIGAGLDGTSIHFTVKTSEQSSELEGIDDSRARTTLAEYEVDDFGNVLTERHWGEIVGSDKLAGNDEAITLRTFANNEQDWLLGHLATEELQDGRGHRVAMKRLFYDGAAYVGLPLGQVARGDVTRQEAWVGPAADAFELEIASQIDADGNPTETRDARGGGHLFEWDAHDHTTVLSESAKLEWGLLVSRAETDRAFGEVVSVTGYDGQTTSFQYDAFGRVTAAVSPGDSSDKPTVRYTYVESAPLSRVITESRLWQGKDDVERSEDLIDGSSRKRGTLKQEAGRWVLAGVSLLDAKGEERRSLRARFVGQVEHDAPPLHADGPGEDVWRDAMGRTLRTRSQLGIEARKEYAPFALRTWDGAQNDLSSTYEHTPVVVERDGLGRTVRTTETLEGKDLSATFAYDAAGALVSKRDADGNAYRYAYDGRGRRVSVDDPNHGHHDFVHDATGNLIEHHKPGGIVSRSTFDIGGRPLTEDWDGDGKPEVTHTWDRSARHPGDLLYAGKLVAMADPSGSIENEYDERQRVIATHRTIDGHTYDDASAFDDRDREVLHTYADGSSLRIRYNPRGQLEGYGHAVDVAYDGDGVELRRSFNTGVVQETGYDDDRRKTESRVRAANGTVLQDLVWTYDGASNLAKVEDRRPSIDTAHDRTETYALDNLYRLRGVTASWGTASWRYSASGNLLERTSSDAKLNAGILAYGEGAGPHALTHFMGRSITYDARGNMTNDGNRTFTWNDADQLVRVETSTGTAAESTFDGAGVRRIRVETSANGETHTTHFLDAWSEVRDGKLVRFIVHGGKRIAQLANGNGAPTNGTAAAGSTRAESEEEPPSPGTQSRIAALFSAQCCIAMALLAALLASFRGAILTAGRRAAVPLMFAFGAVAGCSSAPSPDHQNLDGSILVLSDADELLFDDAIGTLTEQTSGAGNEQSTFAAFPYGIARFDSSVQTRKYANTPRDEAIGLDQMGARSYAPDLGVWTSPDPVGVEDPTRGIGHSLGAANAYSYAGQNPTIANDEHGHWLHIAIGAAVGALVGGGFEAYKQYAETGHIESWGRVAGHAAVGAVAGALVAAMPNPATIGGVIALGAGEGVVTGVANRLIDSGGKSAGTLGDAAADAVGGALTAGVAAGAGVLVRKAAGPLLRRAGSAAGEIASSLRVKTGLKAGSAGGGEKYSRSLYGGAQTNGPAARAIRKAAEGRPCPLCNEPMISGTKTAPSPEHSPSLVRHFHFNGGKNMTQAERETYASSAEAFDGANCLTCQRKQGGQEAAFSRGMNKAQQSGGGGAGGGTE